MSTIHAGFAEDNARLALTARARLALALVASVFVCSYALLWDLSVVHYYAMMSDPQRLADQMVVPSVRALWHVLLLPCLIGAYFLATGRMWLAGHPVAIAAKQVCLLLAFALLVRPVLYLACYLAQSGDVASGSLGTFREFMDVPSWLSNGLNYSLVYSLGLLLVLGFVMFAKYRQEQLRAAAMQTNWLQARLEALRANLHPHFLFNTLNTISAFVASRPQEARELIAQLAALLRDSVMEWDSEFCPLGRENDLAEKYLRIIGVRFGERFKPGIEIPESLKERLVPRGLLLTLVENAATHGVCVVSGDCALSVACASRDGSMLVEVRNRYDRLAAKSGRRGGLAALRVRLQALYGSAYRLEYGGDGECWRVLVAFPLRDTQAPRAAETRDADDAVGVVAALRSVP